MRGKIGGFRLGFSALVRHWTLDLLPSAEVFLHRLRAVFRAFLLHRLYCAEVIFNNSANGRLDSKFPEFKPVSSGAFLGEKEQLAWVS